MTKLDKMQAEIIPWVAKNFPGRDPRNPLLGIVEEFGELSEALDEHDNYAKVKDGVADIVIFMADYCTAMGVSLQDTFSKAEQIYLDDVAANAEWWSNDTKWLGRLAQAHLKMVQKIRGTPEYWLGQIKEALVMLLVELMYTAGERETPFDVQTVTLHAWDTDVSKRDWSKHRLEHGLGEM